MNESWLALIVLALALIWFGAWLTWFMRGAR